MIETIIFFHMTITTWNIISQSKLQCMFIIKVEQCNLSCTVRLSIHHYVSKSHMYVLFYKQFDHGGRTWLKIGGQLVSLIMTHGGILPLVSGSNRRQPPMRDKDL